MFKVDLGLFRENCNINCNLEGFWWILDGI